MGIEQNKKKDELIYSRHSAAGYKSYAEIVASDNPQRAVDPENQVYPDLTEAGVELAKKEAEKLFAKLDPEKDDVFFVSSNQTRALETAAIYRDVAKERGFQIIQPSHVKPDYLPGNHAERVGGGDIRVIRNLSLHSPNAFADCVFNPDRIMPKINFDAVDAETKARWEKAHAIIQADDKGSWGANLFYHADAVKEYFPEVQSAKELFEREFKNLIRLAEFGLKKAADHPKSVKILAFGHENYLGEALHEYFDEHAIKNCETLTISADDSGELGIEKQVGTETIRRNLN